MFCCGTAFFPSAGYRHNTSGVLTNVGASGFCWSSSVSGSDAGYLYMGSANTYLQFNLRANALS